ncbi:hypothetical protein [Halobacteriovorax sp. HLS]|uniref:hypothetical protein n=1 Tax=Halobacteriovorax sp. HLS TaxID=2234000 RepID=UPI000FDC7C40|nr:hypothetical protein [Halobacteriovorax sp. HLS]
MKNVIILSLLVFTSNIFAIEEIMLSPQRRIELNREFSIQTAPLIDAFGSGDIVGNGGGLLEQNFYHAYYSVQTAIENCLSNIQCYTNSDQKKVLKDINNLFIKKIGQKNILIFLKNSQTNDFFEDEYDNTQRLAKTGFSYEHPIFINLERAESITNNVPAMISILIHELGHQVGIASHGYLDRISAKVRRDWDANWTVSTQEVGQRNLDIRLFSTPNNFISAKLSYELDGKVKSLNSEIFKQLKCNDGESLYGFYLSNGHWSRPTATRHFHSVEISYWLDVYCKDTYGSIWAAQKDLTVTFDFHRTMEFVTDLANVKVQIKE